jgi:hypothetical protein
MVGELLAAVPGQEAPDEALWDQGVCDRLAFALTEAGQVPKAAHRAGGIS